MILKTYLITFFFFYSISQPLYSAEKSWRASVGYGIALKNNIRKDNNYSNGRADIIFNHIPLVQLGWGPISIGAQGLTASFIGNKDVAGYLNLNRAGDRYYATGMSARYDSWFLGAGVKYYNYNFLLTRDIDGRSHGYKMNFSYAALYPIGEKVFTRSSVGIECFSESYSNYYYGVSDNEATSSRNAYHPKAYCVPTASFFPGYKITNEINVLIGVSLKLLTNSVRNSPTTTGAWLESALILGASWKF